MIVSLNYLALVMEILENFSLKKYNTFGIDVKAKYFAQVNDVADARELIRSDIFKNNMHFILGGGSNLLFIKDFDGLIVQCNASGISVIEEKKDIVKVRCGAGESWQAFVDFCVRHDLGGVENLNLIPGNVGAAPIQNIGAYGVEQKDVFFELRAFDLQKGKLKTFRKKDCDFSYRSSIFKKKFPRRFLIMDVTYVLTKNHNFNLTYGALQSRISEESGKKVNLKLIAEIIKEIRQSKLPDPEKVGNAGSFFKNPIVDPSHFKMLRAKYPELVAYKLEDGSYKLAAGWLIEKLGWKGRKIGNAAVHDKQALVLINSGNASGKEIYDLSDRIWKDIKANFDVELEREVIVV